MAVTGACFLERRKARDEFQTPLLAGCAVREGGWRAILGGLIWWVGGSQTVVAWWLPMAGS